MDVSAPWALKPYVVEAAYRLQISHVRFLVLMDATVVEIYL
jgi:hypothetical protein